MKTLTHSMSIALLGVSLAIPLTACDSRSEFETKAAPVAPAKVVAAAPRCYDCGTITNVEQMTAEGEGTGLGVVLGAAAGAVVGHQVGDGRGQDVATVGGAVVGGIAGNEVEKRVRGTKYFQVTVTLDNGGATRTVDVASMNGLASGSRVKVVGNNLQPIA
jgi:outer membrane lipoprotein SlyB